MFYKKSKPAQVKDYIFGITYGKVKTASPETGILHGSSKWWGWLSTKKKIGFALQFCTCHVTSNQNFGFKNVWYEWLLTSPVN